MKKYIIVGTLGLLLSTSFMNQSMNVAIAAETKAADVVTTASIVNKQDTFINALSEKGTWIIAVLNNMKFDKELVVVGEFHDKGDAKNAVYRKLALYAQDDKRNVTARYTVTAPKLTVKSPNFKIQGGTFVGDVYVQANGFTLTDAKVQGNVYFAKDEYKASFNMADKGAVTGTMAVKAMADVVTTASIVNQGDAFIKAISDKGTWIIAVLNDLKFTKELVVAGQYHDKGDAKNPVYRKLALYAQDDKYNVTARYTVTAPKMTVKSQNFKIQGGTFVGDVYVEANGFTLTDAKIQGNVYFAKAEYKASFNMSNKGVVTGTIKVK